MEAFAQAISDALAHPERDIHFKMRKLGGQWFELPCREFVSLRAEEEECIRQAFADLPKPKVLDIGCGIGRHLQFVRSIAPEAQITGVEVNRRLREVCLQRLPNATLLECSSKVPGNNRFDMVFLMGNGLGIFGDEFSTRLQLARICGLLEDGGSVLLEFGNPFGGQFYEAHHEIEYHGDVDGPFAWGYASEQWVRTELERTGFTVLHIVPSSGHDDFYICHAIKTTTACPRQGFQGILSPQMLNDARLQNEGSLVDQAVTSEICQRASRSPLSSPRSLNYFPRTFFYPGAGLDFQPLCRLTHLFDRFILCDLSVTEEAFRRVMANIGNLSSSRRCDRPTGGLELISLRLMRPSSIPQGGDLLRSIGMSPREATDYWRLHDLWQGGPKWGMQATLLRRIGRSQKRISLFYLGAEGTATYLRLFTLRGRAPEAICIKAHFQDLGLRVWAGLLGRAVRCSPKKPNIIFGDADGWPWEVPWQSYGRGWDVQAKVAASLPAPVPQVLDGARRVHLIPARLQPCNVGSAQAVLVGRQSTAQEWPPGVEVISLGQILDTDRGDWPTEDERAIQPMDRALQRLEEICRNRGIERVAAVPFGFEDEGQALSEWRAVDGWPREITFYCPTHGDFYSLGGSF